MGRNFNFENIDEDDQYALLGDEPMLSFSEVPLGSAVDIDQLPNELELVPYGTPVAIPELTDKRQKRIQRVSDEFKGLVPWIDFRLGELEAIRPAGRSFAFHNKKLADRNRMGLIVDLMTSDAIPYTKVVINDLFGDIVYKRECYEFDAAPKSLRIYGSKTDLPTFGHRVLDMPVDANPMINIIGSKVGTTAGPMHSSEPNLGRAPRNIGEVQAMTAAATMLIKLLEPFDYMTQDEYFELGEMK